MTNKIKNNILLFLLIGIAFVLCFTNYTPGTILSGWDTLHPEFNFGLNFERAINGVFREEQGLGAVAAHSHMTDLPRMLILYFNSFFLPDNFLRYSYIFLNLIIGPIGMYFFLQKILIKNKIGSFLGGLFYLLNLGTMQQFVVPFEMFTTQYAFLPWLFLFATQFINAPKKDNIKLLLLFCIATILASPMAYAATLWYVYFFVLVSYLVLMIIPQILKRDFSSSKRAFVLIVVTLILNLYWILPNIYYVLTHATEVSEASINKIFSPQAFLYNKEFGNLVDISFLKSFLFDWSVYAGNNNFEKLLSVWIQHQNNPFVLGIGFFFAIVVLIGIIKQIISRNKILICFIPALLFCLLFLFNDNFPAKSIFNFLRNNIAFFEEAYRFPANKVFIIFTFIYTLLFTFGVMTIIDFLTKKSSKFQFINNRIFYTFIFAFLIIMYMSPAFTGNLISPYVRTKITHAYFDMFDWFSDKPKDAKIANLPIYSIFGWEYYNWGFQGSGFIWFGLKQPLLNRDFDRWSIYNEQYYQDMSYAIYSENPILLKNTLEKYNIKYILIDKSIIAPQYSQKVLFYNETQALLESQEYIKKVKDFDNTLFIYEVNLNANIDRSTYKNITDNQGRFLSNDIDINNQNQINNKIEITPPQKEIIPDINSLNYLLDFCNTKTQGSFGIEKENKINSFSLLANNVEVCMTIPLKPLLEKEKLSQNSMLGLKLNHEPKQNAGTCLSSLSDKTCIDYGLENTYFNLSNLDLNDLGLTFYFDASNKSNQKAIFKDIAISIHSNFSTKSSEYSKNGYLSTDKIKFSNSTLTCEESSFVNPFEGYLQVQDLNHFLKYTSLENITCDRFSYKNLSQNQAYLVSVTSRNLKGLPLYLCVENQISKHCDIYANLSSSSDFAESLFLLREGVKDGKGYDIVINNFGIKGSPSENDIKSIKIIPIPNNFISQIKQENESVKDSEVKVLHQSFNQGFLAFEIKNNNFFTNTFPFLFGEKLKEHVLVNNWANGWIIDSDQRQATSDKLIIIFWPQYLQYLGFILLAGTLGFLLVAYFKKPTE